MLTFVPGHTLVHPVHGPVTVVDTRSRAVKGRTVDYVDVSVVENSLTISLPVDRAEEIGLRSLYSSEQVETLLTVLRDESRAEEAQWSRRFKATAERLASGDTLLIAGVVRDLWRRRDQAGISTGERDQLEKAKKPLITELVLALELTPEAAEAMMRDAILAHGHRFRTANIERTAALL